MRETYFQPPYSEVDETNPAVGQLREDGKALLCGIVDENPTTDITEFPGHSEVSLGHTLGYVRHPMGEDRMVWVGHTLAFDRDRWEARVEALTQPEERDNKLIHYEVDGWEVLPSTPDRIVLIRERMQT